MNKVIGELFERLGTPADYLNHIPEDYPHLNTGKSETNSNLEDIEHIHYFV